MPPERAMKILQEENPEGTAQRRALKLVRREHFSFASNFCWHYDNFDKLRPYGLPIYGGVDSFSRKVIWLELCRYQSCTDSEISPRDAKY